MCKSPHNSFIKKDKFYKVICIEDLKYRKIYSVNFTIETIKDIILHGFSKWKSVQVWNDNNNPDWFCMSNFSTEHLERYLKLQKIKDKYEKENKK